MVFMYTSMVTLAAHVITFINIDQILIRLDRVYASNTRLAELAQCINEVQGQMYAYLNVKNTDALEGYYASVQNLQNKLYLLNEEITDSEPLMMERHIRYMGETYIEETGDAVQAKRGRNIRQYNTCYKEASELKEYIDTYIETLNSIQFQENSANYLRLRHSLASLELISTLILAAVIGFNILILLLISRQVTKPLLELSKRADQVAAGDFEVDLMAIHTGDEVEALAGAFNQMIISIRTYIEKLKASMVVESKMKENELKMENYLKDARLKYLQAQVNPHFLFNTLNAAMQLAMIEGAEQTSVFLENVAEFFRYSLKNGDHETTLEEELCLVDHYIYILNVRFCGEIRYEKEIDERLIKGKVPSMIIQPIVENVFQYGIRDIEWQGIIHVGVFEQEGRIHIEIRDNGRGMSKEQIHDILTGKAKGNEKDKRSNGIGLSNVMSRLRLYYGIEEVMMIESEGSNRGTTVTLYLPLQS